MYQYINSRLRKRGKNQKWEDVNIAGVLLSTLLKEYIDGHITLSTNGIDRHHVDFELFKQSRFPFTNVAFSTWLNTPGIPTLPTTADEPVYTQTNIFYSDAMQADYRLRACKNDVVPTAPDYEFYIDAQESFLSLAEKPDLALFKENANMELFKQTCLVSINGFYHRSVGRGIEAQVIDGARSALKAAVPSVGITSFADIGGLTQIAITDEMILEGNPETPSTPYSQQYGVYIHTGVDMRGKSVIVCLGGYMHVEDIVYDVVNKEKGIVKINIDEVNMPQRIFESENWIDLSSLGLTRSIIRTDAVSVPELYSNRVIRNYLKLPQSFIIVVDIPVLHTKKIMVQDSGSCGVYTAPTPVLFPLRNIYGRLLAYWERAVEEETILEIEFTSDYEYLMNTTAWRNELVVNNTVIRKADRNIPCYLDAIYGMIKE